MSVAWTSPSTLALGCDGCGRRLPGYAFTPDTWPTAWAIAVDAEWSGTADAAGTHFCDRCASAADNNGRPVDTELRATIASTGSAGIAVLAGALEAGTARRLSALLEWLTRRWSTLVLDLGAVTRIDSVALRAVASSARRCQANGGHLTLVRPSRFLRETLRRDPDIAALCEPFVAESDPGRRN